MVASAPLPQVWAVWRGVQRAFEEEEFEGSVEDFEHAFAALATDGALDRGELARTGLLSRAEAPAARTQPGNRGQSSMGVLVVSRVLSEWCSDVKSVFRCPHLRISFYETL